MDAFDKMAKENRRLGTELLKAKMEVDRLTEYLKRHLVATCPDPDCDEDCKKCPEVDKWIAKL
jgi:hypothetical protein